jgi:hypothetical protein
MANEIESGANEADLALLVLTDPVEALKQIYAGLLVASGCDEEDIEDNFDDLEDVIVDAEFCGVTVELVHDEGGGEGGGEYVERVYALILNGVQTSYVRQTGSYCSYDGTHWDEELQQVFPHEVMVIKYKENR